MSNNAKYLMIVVAIGVAAYLLHKKYKLVKK